MFVEIGNVFTSCWNGILQYIQPKDNEKLAQAELLVIDEAAAIPLPVVKALLGPYLVFLCSTVNGYVTLPSSLIVLGHLKAVDLHCCIVFCNSVRLLSM